MHDLDRTTLELSDGFDEEYDGDESEYFEYDLDEPFLSDALGGSDSPFDEATEMELAAELLTISDDEELEQFIGGLGRAVKKAAGRARQFARSQAGRQLTQRLRGLAKRALPVAGGAVGTFLGGPAGAAIGSRIASGAGQAFGLELEGLSPEDQEFEVARQVLRFSGEALKNAIDAPQNASPQAVVSDALKAAAEKHAPGLLKSESRQESRSQNSGRSGKWIRRGRTIILFGA